LSSIGGQSCAFWTSTAIVKTVKTVETLKTLEKSSARCSVNPAREPTAPTVEPHSTLLDQAAP
jgi:hypothetical protein